MERNENYINRYCCLLDALNIKYLVNKGIIWMEYYKGMLQPLGPASSDFSISDNDAKFLLKKSECLLIRWSNGFYEHRDTDWYVEICTDFIGVENLSSKTRCEVRSGLRRNEVKLIDAVYLSENGYDAYFNAFKRYKGSKPEFSRDKFRKHIKKYKDFNDIVHIWGVFNKEKIVGFAINYLFDKTECFHHTVMFDPEYLRDYSAYALYYTMAEFYLKKEKFEYINEGFRNILHKTEIYDFLEHNFNFKKCYTNLNVVYNKAFQSILKILKPFRCIIKRIEPRLDALYTQDSFSSNKKLSI